MKNVDPFENPFERVRRVHNRVWGNDKRKWHKDPPGGKTADAKVVGGKKKKA